MRIGELHLLAYGKFTDHRLAFPRATHDFNVIIGPNEAGKSTVRRAITELMFGMERQSPLGFKHPQSDLRVSGVIEAAAGKLAFIRTKQQKSLRSLAGDALPDAYLENALGSLTQESFEQLHCLDHERLLKGGQGIVDPRNSVSQILFQAASGLEGFAAVREVLEEQAAELFASRGKNNAYSRAAERYASAQKTLKDVQVRTREWVAARDALQSARDELDKERASRRELETSRTAWERARRLAPLVERLARLQQELAGCGDTIAFAPSARETLDAGIAAIDAATARMKTRAHDVAEREQNVRDIVVDQDVLERAAEIERLASLCGLYANHAKHLPLRRNEVDNWLKELLARSAEFGWGVSEQQVRDRLPSERVLRLLEALLKDRGALLADERAAKKAEQERHAEVQALGVRLEAVVDVQVTPALAQALAGALPHKGSDARQAALLGALQLAENAARDAMSALGRPDLTHEALRAMQLPSPERVTALRARRQEIVQALDLARSLAGQSAAASADVALKIAQFERSRKIVTAREVADARRHRDEKWLGIKSGATALAESAPHLDVAIRLADELVDARTLSETDGAALQALRDQAERVQAEHARHLAACEAHGRELAAFDEEVAGNASRAGLHGLPLDDTPDWLSRRAAALQAADHLAAKRQEFEAEQAGAAQAFATLVAAIRAQGLSPDDGGGLGTLCAIAEQHARDAERSRTQREALEQQLLAAEQALKVAQAELASRGSAVADWNARWQEALSRAHLAGVTDDVAEVESAVAAAVFIRQRIEKVDAHRTERIDAMEADLRQLAQVAAALAEALCPDLSGFDGNEGAAQELSRRLLARLEEAKRQANRRTQAQEFLDSARRQLVEEKSALAQARRSLEPLLQIAGVADPMQALPLVEQAQRKAAHQQALSDAIAELEAGCDGLTLEQVKAEVQAHPAVDAPAQLLLLHDRMQDSERRLTQLLAAELGARQVFDAIDGGDRAALAEAQRQEAIAEMSQASEQYLEVATAGRLLKWAVDKYRDRKQGPLLQRASTVFSALTCGSFEKLRIDHDQTPAALLAYRANHQAVKVSGLSDGTRDQLFLALRIAALELQAEQGSPVPFVADDLFINFDDGRSRAGLQALYELSARTQVLFLSHQEHLVPVVRDLFPAANVIVLEAEADADAGMAGSP